MWINGSFYDMAAKPVWSVDWSVRVNGRNMTDVMRPRLIDLSVTDNDGTSSDSCALTFDDSDGDIDLDIEGRTLEIDLNGVNVFSGFVESSRSNGSRGGGRLALVSGTGLDPRGKAKQAQAFHKDDAKLGDFLREAAGQAGYELVVDDDLAGLERDYWSADYESFQDIGERIGREVNGTFKFRGNKAVLAARGATALNTIDAVFGPGGNVISWDLAPFTGRPAYAKAEARYFDRKQAKFITEDIDLDLKGFGGDTVNRVRFPVGNAGQAQNFTKGRKSEAKRERGGGSIDLDITPEAQVEGIVRLSGAQPAVDIGWRISSVGHKANRAGGSTTGLEVKEPGAT